MNAHVIYKVFSLKNKIKHRAGEIIQWLKALITSFKEPRLDSQHSHSG